MSRQMRHGDPTPAWGANPAIPEARPQGAIPGLKVNAFAVGLKHPRWIYVLPTGDVLIAESSNVPRQVMRTVFDYAMVATMRRARAVGSAPTASRCCATPTAMASRRPRRCFLKD
jgi:glucose/arabinose dehydrogenase